MANQERPDAVRLADLGPFFAFDAEAVGAGWQPLRTLTTPSVLAERVDQVREALVTASGARIEPRVAASTLSLSLFARLASPVAAAAVLDLSIPRPGLDSTWWRPVDGGPWPLALTRPPTAADPAGLVDEVIAPLVESFSREHSVSVQILRGNAASAVVTAAAMAARADAASNPVARAERLVSELLGGALAGTGHLSNSGFVRSTCCLYYRVPGGGYCGDCVLVHR